MAAVSSAWLAPGSPGAGSAMAVAPRPGGASRGPSPAGSDEDGGGSCARRRGRSRRGDGCCGGGGDASRAAGGASPPSGPGGGAAASPTLTSEPGRRSDAAGARRASLARGGVSTAFAAETSATDDGGSPALGRGRRRPAGAAAAAGAASMPRPRTAPGRRRVRAAMPPPPSAPPLLLLLRPKARASGSRSLPQTHFGLGACPGNRLSGAFNGDVEAWCIGQLLLRAPASCVVSSDGLGLSSHERHAHPPAKRRNTRTPAAMQARATPRGVSLSPPPAAAVVGARPAAAARRPHRRLAAAPSDLLVLDFDGVIVDSEPEVSVSALGAASVRWPEAFGGGEPTGAARAALLAGLKRSRPVLVGGYESMCMVRACVRSRVCGCRRGCVCVCVGGGGTHRTHRTQSRRQARHPAGSSSPRNGRQQPPARAQAARRSPSLPTHAPHTLAPGAAAGGGRRELAAHPGGLAGAAAGVAGAVGRGPGGAHPRVRAAPARARPRRRSRCCGRRRRRHCLLALRRTPPPAPAAAADRATNPNRARPPAGRPGCPATAPPGWL